MDIYFARLDKLRKRIKANQGILITDKSDLFYLTGFRQDGYWGLLAKEKFFLFLLPLLYGQGVNHFGSLRSCMQGRGSHQAEEKLVFLQGKDLFSLFSGIVQEEKLEAVFFDPEKISLSKVEKLKKTARIKFNSCKDLVTDLREIKDANEINLIRKSCQLVLKGYRYAKKIIHPGMSERELANEIEYYLKKEGAQGVSFETIVAGGMNSSYSHHLTSDYIFQENDPVLLDLGVVYRGYSSDLTRVIFLGKITKLFKQVYQIVEEAQKKAITGVKPSVKTKRIFSLAFKVIQQAGYAKYFLHNLGHGIGVDIHEKPYLSVKDKEVLKPGMVFTIEPGIYIPKEFGVRIEDVVLVTEKGCEVLTKSMSYEV
ncbi:MAG TPA: Xaa-Pro dipeptidase [Elusimicrobia bacterium]|jgi:Xaa-Pro aminopeptidase|nr:Xaa-Pro dipeptidase [Elusimicrobiota bacterium]